MIDNAGELVDYIKAAVEGHGATPMTEVRVRIGKMGPEYRIHELTAVKDQRGFSLLLQTSIVPVG